MLVEKGNCSSSLPMLARFPEEPQRVRVPSATPEQESLGPKLLSSFNFGLELAGGDLRFVGPDRKQFFCNVFTSWGSGVSALYLSPVLVCSGAWQFSFVT